MELSTIVARDSADDGSKTDPAGEEAVKSVEETRRTINTGTTGDIGEGDQILTPVMGKAGRRILADSDAEMGRDGPPRDPSRAVEFDLTSSASTPSALSARRRQEEISRVQAEEDEFMRII